VPTHQSLGGASDEELLQRMVATHAERFDAAFWAFFDARVGRRLPPLWRASPLRSAVEACHREDP